jgi:hypothetical protein
MPKSRNLATKLQPPCQPEKAPIGTYHPSANVRQEPGSRFSAHESFNGRVKLGNDRPAMDEIAQPCANDVYQSQHAKSVVHLSYPIALRENDCEFDKFPWRVRLIARFIQSEGYRCLSLMPPTSSAAMLASIARNTTQANH